MAYNQSTGTFTDSDFIIARKAEKKAANDLQLRRHEDWTDNYDLYRNKVKTNRLTQRQAVNIPLMKETVKTILSKIDEAPNVDWEELSGDEEKELVYQEVWNEAYTSKKYELADVLDKKNVLLYGTGTKMLNIEDDGISIDALDPFDIVFDPLMKSGNVESCRFIVRQNIFKSIRDILANPEYTDKAKEELKFWADSTPGLVQTAENKEQWERKMQRLKDMGLTSDKFSVFAGGDRLINITEHFFTHWNGKDWERRVCSYAEDTIELSNKLLIDAIGVEFWPFTVWNEDPESQDIYADSVADLVRTPNKVVNVWYSQYIENRSLSNFGMHWFLPMQGYQPTTYQPGQGVMLPAPPGDDINKVIKPVEIGGLEGTLDAISYITQVVERGTGATAIEKGEPEKGTQTLGEVQVLVGKAMERTVGIAKFYRMAWFETAWKWDRLMHANAPKFMTLYKKSQNGKLYPKRVYAGDWKSKAGYKPVIHSTSEQEQESVKSIQKFTFVLQQFPQNQELRKIAQKRMLESLDLTPEEMKQVEEAENNPQTLPEQQPQESQQPSPIQGELANNLQALNNINAS